MNLVKCAAVLGLSLVLAACGGGGGNPGTPVRSPSAPAVTTAAAIVTLSVVDSAGAEITNHLLSQTQAQFLKAVVTNSVGAVVPYTRVTVTLDSTAAALVPVSGTQLTDAFGVVLMRIAPISVNSTGSVRASAVATVGAVTTAPQTYDFQINAGTVNLSPVTVSPATVQQGQSVNVSVNVFVNGSPATSNSVAVTFNTACGTVSPASALVNSAGRASAVIQTTSSGSCTVDASVNGVTTAPASYTVALPPTTGIQFVSAAPILLYQKGSAGINTSIVTFKVIDSLGIGVQGVAVTAGLTNTDGGISFCGSPSSGNTLADGTISFSVCAGTLPATVQVRAELASNSAIFTNSNLLTIQTGLPTQRFFDISATQLNFYAGGYFTTKFNGNTTTLTVFAADRQGNPVPNGTKIIFVSEGGQINSTGVSSCLITNGRCSVDLIGQDYRPMGSSAPSGDPRPGRVTVLAYTDGEESFVDANFNNRYDAGELFEDLGTLYLDKDENNVFHAAYTNLFTGTNEGEFIYPMPAGSVGAAACPVNSNFGLSVASTCNGVWDGLTKVRRQMLVVFSGGEIGQPGFYDSSIPADKRTAVLSVSSGGVAVQLADYNGNPLPSDAAVAAEVINIPTGSQCAATLLGGSTIGNTTEPTLHSVSLKDCVSGETLLFKATVGTKVSSLAVLLPSVPGDTTPPVTSGPPAVEVITATGATLTAKINEAGTGYYKIQLAAQSAPSVAGVIAANQTFTMTANTSIGLNLSGLTTGTAYTIYFVAKDIAGNTQAAVGTVNFTTL